jgi:hypothetical protein
MDNSSLLIYIFNFLTNEKIADYLDPIELILLLIIMYYGRKFLIKVRSAYIEFIKVNNSIYARTNEIDKIVKENQIAIREEMRAAYTTVADIRDKSTIIINRFDEHQKEESRQHTDIGKVVNEINKDIGSIMTMINTSISLGKPVK